MPCHHAVIGIDQNRVGPTEDPDRIGDLADLLLGVGARVVLAGDQRADKAPLDHKIAQGHRNVFVRQFCHVTLAALRRQPRVSEEKCAWGLQSFPWTWEDVASRGWRKNLFKKFG